MTDDPQPPLRLSIADAASHLGVSVDTVRRRIKRQQLAAQRDNTGRWWVVVPTDAKASDAMPKQRAAYAPMQNGDIPLIAALREQNSFLQAQLERLRADIDRAHAEHRAERQHLLDQHRADLQSLLDQHRSERQQLFEFIQHERTGLLDRLWRWLRGGTAERL